MGVEANMSTTMNNKVRVALVKYFRSFGPSLIEQPKRLRALLADECPGKKREINVLLTALAEKIPATLHTKSASAPWVFFAGRLVKQLTDLAAMDEEAARWAVDTWALAMGLIHETDLISVGTFPKPPPIPVLTPTPILLKPVPKHARNWDDLRASVKLPATFMILTGALGIALAVFVAIEDIRQNDSNIFVLFAPFLGLVAFNLVTLLGGIKLRELRSRIQVAIAAGFSLFVGISCGLVWLAVILTIHESHRANTRNILAVLSIILSFMEVTSSIYTLVTINNPEIKSSFDRN